MMNEEQKQEMLSFLANAGASEDDRSFWILRFERISREAAGKVIEFFTSFPGEIKNLRLLQEKREKALGNSEEWEKFIQEEEHYFANLLASQQHHGRI